jgi:hypothetical protein
MNIRKMQQLERLGFDPDWLLNVKENFKPRKHGRYEIKIYDIEDLDQDPETGIWIDTTCFDNDMGLSIVHFFFEGNAYVMRDKEKDEIIGAGIIDGSPFEECEENDGKQWKWYSADELGPWFAHKREEDLEKLTGGHARIRKRKIYVVMTQSKIDYDFSVTTIKHGAYNDRSKAITRLKREVEKFKAEHLDDCTKYSNTDIYHDEDNGAWTECECYNTGYWGVTFGCMEDYESHQITIEAFEIED